MEALQQWKSQLVNELLKMLFYPELPQEMQERDKA